MSVGLGTRAYLFDGASGIAIQGISGAVAIAGLNYATGLFKPLNVDSSGNLDVDVVILTSGIVSLASGQSVVASSSGNLMTVASGFVGIIGGVQTSGIMGVSGQVSLLSGEVHVMSGVVNVYSGTIAATVSGSVNILSGQIAISSGVVQVLSGQIYINSGFVQTTSGSLTQLMSGTNIIGQVSVTSGLLTILSGQIYINSGFVQTTSGSVTQLASGNFIIGQVSVASGEVHLMSGNVLIGGYSYQNVTSGIFNLKSGTGILHTVSVNTKGTATTLTLFDNVSGAGPKIATIDTTLSQDTLSYDLSFSSGLTVSAAGTTAADLTVTYK